MAVSVNSLDDLNFVWDPNANKNLDLSYTFDNYLNFLEEMAPVEIPVPNSGLLRDIVFTL